MQPQVASPNGLVKPLFKKSRKKWIYGSIAVVVVLGVGIPIAMKRLHATTPLPTSTIYTVGYNNITQSISTSGTIQPAASVNLNFQGSGGLLKQLDVKIGQHVTAGQVLAQVDNSSEKIQVTQAQSGVTQANANLLTAETKLAQTEAGATSSTIFNDQQNIQKAQLSLNQAELQYQAAVQAYNNPTTEQQQLQSAQNAYQQAEQNASDTSGVTAAQQQLQNDQTTLQQAETNLSTLQSQYNAVYAASLGSNSTATPAQVNSAYQAVQQAQNTVTQDTAKVQADQNAVTTATKQLQQAQQTAAQDKQNLATLQQQFSSRTADKQALASAQNAVAQAQLNLAGAKEQLKTDQQPPDAATLQQAQASVTTAQASLQNAEAQLQSAEQNLANTTMTSPISGVISQINATQGEMVSGSSPLIVVTDTNKQDLQVNIQVSESQIGSVKVGDPVQLTVTAYPGKTYSGSIIQVYPTPTVTSNVTEYTVIASVNNSNGDLKDGMSASVNIQTAQATHVLTVPAIALQQFGAREGVYVVDSTNSSGSSSSGSSTSSQSSGQGRSKGSGSGSGSGSGGFGGGNGSGSGSASGGGNFSGGAGAGGTTGSGGFTRGQGSGTAAGGGGGAGGFFGGGASRANSKFGPNAGLPSNVHFQPVQVGLYGTNDVEITQGLQAGEQILIELPAAAAANAASSSSSTRFGGGAGAAGRVGRQLSGGGGKG